MPQLPPDLFARLPEPAALSRLAAAAARAYSAPSPDCVVPTPGMQIVLPLAATGPTTERWEGRLWLDGQ